MFGRLGGNCDIRKHRVNISQLPLNRPNIRFQDLCRGVVVQVELSSVYRYYQQ